MVDDKRVSVVGEIGVNHFFNATETSYLAGGRVPILTTDSYEPFVQVLLGAACSLLLASRLLYFKATAPVPHSARRHTSSPTNGGWQYWPSGSPCTKHTIRAAAVHAG